MFALYLLFLPPFCYSSVDSAAIADYTDADAPSFDYFVDDLTLYCRATRQAAIPLSHISPTYMYLSVALGICCCYHSVLFQLHSLSLSPLDYLSDILCCLNIYNIYSSGPCALLDNRIS